MNLYNNVLVSIAGYELDFDEGAEFDEGGYNKTPANSATKVHHVASIKESMLQGSCVVDDMVDWQAIRDNNGGEMTVTLRNDPASEARVYTVTGVNAELGGISNGKRQVTLTGDPARLTN